MSCQSPTSARFSAASFGDRRNKLETIACMCAENMRAPCVGADLSVSGQELGVLNLGIVDEQMGTACIEC